MKNLDLDKDPVRKMKRQATAWEKIGLNLISNKELVSRMYKALSTLNSEKTKTIQLENGQKT